MLGGIALLSAAQASTLIWSPTGQSSGGSGTWDTTSSAWYNGTITMPWNNAAGDSASFGGPGGTVTLAGPISVQDLSFATSGYILTGGSLNSVSAQSAVNVSGGATATINSVISGSGMLASTGSGKLILGGVNTWSGGTSVSGGGVLQVSSDSNLGAAAGGLTLGSPSTMGTLSITGAFSSVRNVTINIGGGNISVSPAVTATFNGVLSGSGALGFTGTGTTVLNGANSWTGTTTVGAGGTLQVGTGSTTGTLGTGATVDNGVLVFNRSNAYTYSGIISGTGALQNTGSGTTILTGASTYTGGTTISAGTLQLGNNGTAGWITGNVIDNGTLLFNRSDANTFAGTISGSGVVRNAAGTLTLSGVNTYSGGTEIQGGTLKVASDASLGAASGKITFTGTSSLQASTSFTTSRAIVINSGVTGFTNTSSGTLTLSGPVSGAGSFGVNGGTVVLAGTGNTYSGTTNINAGILQINDESNLSSNAAAGITFSGGGILRVMSTGALARNIVTNTTTANIDAYNGAVVTVNGTISGAGGMAFYGGGTAGGTVILTGNNTYTGGTWFWTGSKVIAASNSNLGGAAGTWSFSNGTLATTATFASSHSVAFSAAGTLDVANGTTLTLSGAASGGGQLIKTNTGVLVLTGANSWTGGATISAGTLQVGNGGTSGSLGTGNVINNATLAFNRSDSTSYSNVISGTGTVIQTGNGTTTLSGSNSYKGATTVSAGSLYVNGDQTSATGLTSVASGATLGGNGTIGSSVTIANGGILAPGASTGAAGTLTIKGNLALSASSVLNYNLGQAGTVGGPLNDLTVVSGNLTLGGTLNVVTSTGGTFDAGVYRIISYSGALTNNGMALGSLPAGANATLQTSVAGQVNLINNYAGTTFWDGATGHDNGAINGGAGIWNTGAGANSNWTDSAGVANGTYSTNFAVFQGTPGIVTVDNSLGQVGVTGMQFMTNGYRINGGAISLNETTPGSGYTIARVGDGTAAGSGYTATIDSALGGAVGLSKTDLGTLILTGTNTYTGGTNISGGTLQLGDGTTNGSVLGNIIDTGVLALKPASGTTMALSGIVSGSGALNMTGTGTAVLTGANTYSGGTTISSGILQIGNGGTAGAFGSGNVTVAASGTLVFNRSDTNTYGNVISGAGAVAQNGSGTTVLTGNNTYTGGTTINAGTLQLGNGGATGSVTGNIINNGQLVFNRNAAYTFAGIISGSGSVTQGAGSLTLSGINTYTGDTILTGSSATRLFVTSNANIGAASSRVRFTGNTTFAWLVANNALTMTHDIIIDSGSQGQFGSASNAAPLTLSGSISGAGLLGVRQGTVYLTGSSTYSGGTYINGATLGVTGDASLGQASTGIIMDNGAIFQALNSFSTSSRVISTANTGGTIQTVNGATLTLNGDIGGGGGLTFSNTGTGTGTVILTGNAAHAGTTVNNGMTLQIGNGGTTGSVSSTIANNGVVAFNRSDNLVYGNVISGTGSLQQNGVGTLTLAANQTYSGGTTINAGTLQLGNGGTTGWVNGAITNNSVLAFKRSDSVTYSSVISGSGAVQQNGSGVLVLTGNNLYTSGTTINAGTLQVSGDNNLGAASGALSFNGGTLATTATFSSARNVFLGGSGGTFDVASGTTLTLSSPVAGSGGLTKTNLGTLVLENNNTYTGATTVSAGTLYIDGNQAASTGATTVASGATLGGSGTLGGSVTIANGANLAPGSEDGTGGTLTINGNLQLNALSNLNYQFGKVNGVAENSRTDVNGNLTLDGRLNVSVPTSGIFSAGVYRVFNYTGALTNNGLVLGSVPAGATLALQSSVPGQVNLINSTGQLLAFWDGTNPANYNQGSGEGGSGSWRLLGGTAWADASGTSNSAYGNQSFAVFGGTAGTVTVDNSFGQIETSGMQFTTDGYVINGGAITLVNSPVNGSTPELRVGDGSGASKTMTATISAVLQGATSVTKTDLGTLVLTGVNTYTGGTSVNSGILQISADANLGATAGTLSFGGGALATTASFTSARTTTLNAGGGTFDTASGTTLTMSGAIGGSGSLSKTDSGTLTLTGSNSYSGGTAINGGTVQVAGDGNLGAVAGALSFDGGTLATTGSFSTGRAVTLNSGGGTVDTASGTTLIMSGVVDGSGALTRTNTGTLVLTNNNTYSGGTTISAGTLQLGNGGTTGAITGDVTNSGALAFNRIDSTTFSGVISGSGAVNQIGLGQTILSGINSYSGGTTISAGTLVAQNDSALGTGAVSNAAALQLDFATDSLLANVLSGSGSLTKTGSGIATLTGSGSSEGAVAVNAGTLVFAQSGAFTAASMDVASGTSVTVNSGANVVLSGAYTQAAGATFNGVVGTQAGVAVTAATASLNGALAITGFAIAAPASASGILSSQYTVIHTTNGISGGFSSVNLNGAASAVDYLHLAGRASGNDYSVGYGLSWLEGQADGTGSFTLAGASDSFDVDVALADQAAGAYVSGWDGKTLTKAGAGTLTLSAVNGYTGDTQVNAGTLRAGIADAFAQSANVTLAAGATLDLNNDNQTANNLSGAGNVLLGSATLTENAASDTALSGIISGTGSLAKTGSGTFTLSGNSTWSGGTTISAGTLQLGDGGTSGSIVGDVTNNGTLVFNRSDTTTFSGLISGSGHVNQFGTGTTVLTGTNSYSGGTTVAAGTLQLGNGGSTGSVQGAIDIASGATLAVNWGAGYTLGNTLTGSGLVTVTAAGNAFDFASAAAGSGFSGTVDLQNATFSLGGVNTGALAAATLDLGSGSVATVADGIQTLGGLTFSGGRAAFNATIPAQVDATGLVQVNRLDVSGTGTVQVTLPEPYVLPIPTPNTELSLLEQDDLYTGTRLASGSTVSGSAGALSLQDQHGNVISAAQNINVQQGGSLVAVGTYDYRLSTGTSQDGLYVSYGLTLLNLQAGQTLALAQISGATGAAADMSAKITGSGNLSVDAGTSVLSLSNATNDFTGDTTVTAGTLQANARDVIATSGKVAVNAGATLDTHGYDQSLANLTGAGTVTNSTATATTLTLNDTATSLFSGSITGAQLALVQAAGTQILTGSNSYGGGTAINAGATLRLGDGGAGGSIIGNVSNNGELIFNRSDAATLAGLISGSGVVNQMGTGSTTLSGVNSYSGGTTISAGTLAAQNGSALGTGAVSNAAALQLDFAADGVLANVLSGSGSLTKSGSGSATLTGTGSSEGAVAVNAGTLIFAQSGAFTATSLDTASGGGVTVSLGTSVALSGALTQAAGATFNGIADSQARTAVTADTASLNGALNITGFGIAAPASASGLSGAQYRVVHTTSGITGDFSSVNLNGAASSLDYLHLAGRISGNDYNVGYGLSWLEGEAGGTGSFTLAGAADAFNLDVALDDQAAGLYASGWDGKTLTKLGAGTLTLSAVNGYTGDTQVNEGTLSAGIADAFAQSVNVVVASGATLDLNSYNQTAHNLSGAGGILLGSATLTENAFGDTTFSGTLSGTGGLSKTGSGVFTLSGANSYSGGTTVSAGTLRLNDAQGAGSGAISIDTTAGSATGGLELAFSRAGNVSNPLTGAGTTTVSGAQATITSVNQGYTGSWHVTDSGQLGVAATAQSSIDNLGTGGIDIAAGGVLNAATQGAFSVDNALTGSGTLNASGNGQTFSFGSGAGSAFSGTVVLTNNTLDLSGNNTTALTNARLSAGSGNLTTVGDGNQQIGGLIINGGTMAFNAAAPDRIIAASLITAGALDISHSGMVRIHALAAYITPGRDVDNSLNLLMQDDVNTGMQLVSSGAVTGSGGAMQLLNQDGSAITAAQQTDIIQNNQLAARGTYDYRLTSGPTADGLYVNYGLTLLDLQAGQTLMLAQNTGATGVSADMSARITGSGNLAIDAAAGVVSLSNSANDYSGQTAVTAGTLRAGADNALGRTSQLNLLAASGFDLNGKVQTVGMLESDAGSLLNLNGGTLTLSSGGTSAGSLSGGGELNITGGRLDIQGANTGLSASTTIAAGATVNINDPQGLGSGEITDSGTLMLNSAAGTMGNNITGTGELVKRGDSETVLSGKTGWTGDTYIDGGGLVLDGSSGGAQLVSNVIGQDNTVLSLRNGATLTGWVDPTNISIDAASSWNMTANSVVDEVNLAGTLNFAAPSTLPMSSGRTLTATSWNGQGGTVVLNTVLGDDASVTDKIVVNGNTSGNTFVKVNNAGGNGANILNGIRIVEVKGQSDGIFSQSGRIVAGAYDYLLEKKGPDWFLTNQYVAPETPITSTDPQALPTPVVRPESASYTANLAAANALFITRLHDRLGESQYTDALTGEQKATSLWLRQLGGHNRFRDSSGQISTQSNRYVAQLGGDIAQWSPDELQRWHLGMMGGYGHSSSNSRSHVTGYRSDGTVSGYSAGLYATWYQNDETKQGMYLDSWAQYGWFNNKVKGESIDSESYRSSGLTASLEAGYAHKLGEFAGSQGSLNVWYIQPQAQVIRMGVTADEYRESTGTRVDVAGENNVQTRLGVRTFLRGYTNVDGGKNGTFQPYAEINWIHNSRRFGTRMDGITLSQNGARNIGEIKAGIEGQLNPRLSVWGNAGVQVGDKGYGDTSAMLGVKYRF